MLLGRLLFDHAFHSVLLWSLRRRTAALASLKGRKSRRFRFRFPQLRRLLQLVQFTLFRPSVLHWGRLPQSVQTAGVPNVADSAKCPDSSAGTETSAFDDATPTSIAAIHSTFSWLNSPDPISVLNIRTRTSTSVPYGAYSLLSKDKWPFV